MQWWQTVHTLLCDCPSNKKEQVAKHGFLVSTHPTKSESESLVTLNQIFYDNINKQSDFLTNPLVLVKIIYRKQHGNN